MTGRILFTTYPDKETASKEARKAVERKEAACASILPVKSIYTWKGRLEEADECLVIFKTTSRKAPTLRRSLTSTHPYDVPEIIELSPDYVDEKYLTWIKESTS